MRLTRILSTLLLILCITGLQAQTHKPEQKKRFRIQRGDNLSIMVMDHPEFTINNLKVMPDGYIQYPVLGSIKAANMTSHQLADSLTSELKKYVVEPIVTIIINKLENNTINVFGYLNKPGKYLVYKPTDMLTAVSLAGGIKNIRKARKITILRKNGDIETYKLKRNLTKKIAVLKKITPLSAGDTVVIKDPMKVEWGMLSLLVTIASLVVSLV